MKTEYKIFVTGKDISFQVHCNDGECLVKELFKLLRKKFPFSEGYEINVYKIEETAKLLITETWQ